MAGYFVYAFCALGLAGFVPRPRGGGHGWLGARLFTGFSLIPVFLFVVHIIAGVGLLAASYALVVLSALGLVRLVAGWVRVPDDRPSLLHPAFVIFAAAGGVIAVHGGLAYIPYSGDEFTNWIGAAKQIFAGGGFDRARPALIHPDYPMGWPLTMVLPAVLAGRFDEGLAAAAPLVMHLALVSLLFDVVCRALEHGLALPAKRARVLGWLVVLAMLLAEATGRLWPISLLIEPPQVYGLVAMSAIAVAMLQDEGERTAFAVSMGIIFASQYLMKVSTLAFAPVLAVLAVLLAVHGGARGDGGALGARLRTGFRLGAMMVIPGALMVLLWRHTSPPASCLTSPLAVLQPDQMALALAPEAVDLGRRFTAAVWAYLSTYKAPLTVLAAAGMAWGFTSRRHYGVALLVVLYGGGYLFALYWYHLTCWSAISADTLYSIERYTRVPVRLFHAVGLLLLVLRTIDLAASGRFAWLRAAFDDRRPFLAAAVAVAVLGAWQVWQVDRTIVDLATRKFQDMYRPLVRIPPDAARIRAMRGNELPPHPRVALIDQEWPVDAWSIANYYAIGTRYGGPLKAFTVIHHLRWETGAGAERQEVLAADVQDVLGKADLVWPIGVGERLRSALAPHIADAECRRNPTAYFLLPNGRVPLSFTCLPR